MQGHRNSEVGQRLVLHVTPAAGRQEVWVMKVILLNLLFVLLTCQAFAENLLSPKDIKLTGLERQASLNSPLGKIELRWPREAETLFGKTPEKATIEAATSIAKALRQSSLPQSLKQASSNWNIIFISSKISGQQVPKSLIDNCHSGWMTPPANIYIVSERIAGECFNNSYNLKKVADSQLARVMIHEMAHALEFKFSNSLPFDRLRSEGFASWFEAFAAQYSSDLDRAQIISEQKSLAYSKLASGSLIFNGNADDYAFGAVMFHIFLENKALSDLTRLYQLISSKKLSLIEAVKSVNSWSDKQLSAELDKYL